MWGVLAALAGFEIVRRLINSVDESLDTGVDRNRNENPNRFRDAYEEISRTSTRVQVQSDPQSTTRIQSHREIPNCDSIPRTSTVSTHFQNQSNAQATKQIISQNCSNSSTLPQKATTSSMVDRWINNLPPVDANKTNEPKHTRESSPFSSHSSPSSSKQPPVVSNPPSVSLSTPPLSSLNSDTSSCSSSSPSYSKPPRVSNKPILSHAPFNPTTQQKKTSYVRVEKGASSIYMIPENIEHLIKSDIVPGVLKKPLSPSTYRDYFKSLLYAEDYYLERWDGFEMENVTLELHEAAIYDKKSKNKNLNRSDGEDDKVFVAFEMDSMPEKRPFLLSRDFASVRPSGRNMEPFQGIIYRVVKSNLVLVEFGEDFHSRHYSNCKYDVKFSFNRICLKRAHQAIESTSASWFKKFLFPDCDNLPNINPLSTTEHLSVSQTLDRGQISAIHQIYNHRGPPPFLVEGPLCVSRIRKRLHILSRTGWVIREAVLQIYRTEPNARILICAPTNNTCDVITKSLQEEIPESSIFRANAAFRELDGVPHEILPSCRYEEERFSVPSLNELKKFKVIVSTYTSCFRLHNEGLVAGDFSQMFMLDASSTTEPEVMVALANLADEWTGVVVTGAPGNCSGWVRSKIARQNGLMTSYFERLRESKLYESLDPRLITQMKENYV